MARVPLPVIPEHPRCPCCSAPVDAEGKFSGWSWSAKPGFVTVLVGEAVDPILAAEGAE